MSQEAEQSAKEAMQLMHKDCSMALSVLKFIFSVVIFMLVHRRRTTTIKQGVACCLRGCAKL